MLMLSGPPSPSYITLHYINVLADYITLQAEKVTLHYITAPQARNFDDYITLQARAGPRPMLRPGQDTIYFASSASIYAFMQIINDICGLTARWARTGLASGHATMHASC